MQTQIQRAAMAIKVQELSKSHPATPSWRDEARDWETCPRHLTSFSFHCKSSVSVPFSLLPDLRYFVGYGPLLHAAILAGTGYIRQAFWSNAEGEWCTDIDDSAQCIVKRSRYRTNLEVPESTRLCISRSSKHFIYIYVCQFLFRRVSALVAMLKAAFGNQTQHVGCSTTR